MPKPTILVCQYLERISRKALETYQDILRAYVRGRHGLYALYQDDRLYYVGLATDLRDRLNSHLRDHHGNSWNRFSVYLTIGDSHIHQLESLVLRIAQPNGNKLRGHFGAAENLLEKFKVDIHQRQLIERQELLGLPTFTSKSTRKRIEDKSLPILAAFVTKSLKLRAKFKGRYVKARVLKNGTVVYDGKRFNSPSLAAAAACERPTCNGWTFWRFERGPHEWVLLNELRK